MTGDWKELVGRGKAPSPRFGHSAVVHQQDKMYIFGGYDGVDRNDLYCFDFGTLAVVWLCAVVCVCAITLTHEVATGEHAQS